MKKITLYIALIALLFTTACTHSIDLYPQLDKSNVLTVDARLNHAPISTTTRALSDSLEAQQGTAFETEDGAYIVTATKERWNPEADRAPATRGTPIGTALGIESLCINIFNTLTADWSTSSTLTTVVNATRSGNSFTVAPEYLWPVSPNEKRTLFAYSPSPTAGNGLSSGSDGKTVKYVVPIKVSDQPDFCAATTKYNVMNKTGEQNNQTFVLDHKLAAVGFSMLAWKTKITRITLSGIVVDGSLALDTHKWTLGTTTGERNAGLTEISFDHSHTSSFESITSNSGHLMMLPQTFTTGDAKVTIHYESTEDPLNPQKESITFPLRRLGITWDEGEKITYNVRLKTAPAVTSGDMVINEHRAGYTTLLPMTLVMDARDELTFTWNAPWLKIHRGSPKVGNTDGGADSGWSTGIGGPWGEKKIYFFATEDNTSKTDDRTVEVTVTGTRSGKKSFNVTQVKEPPSILEVNGLVWAVGNLVADGSNGAKIGDAGDPGLYFQYGGLIGYKGGANGDGTGPVNTSKNINNKWWNGATSYSANDVAVTPAAYTKKGTWPNFAGQVNGGFGYYYFADFTTQYADFQGQPNAYDATNGIGDPCAHYLGSPWRLPTVYELSAITGSDSESTIPWSTSGVTGKWTDSGAKSSKGAWFGPNAQSGNPTVYTDLFIPASGIREDTGSFLLLGTHGFLWTSSVETFGRGYCFLFGDSSFGGVRTRSTNPHTRAMPVRCVKNK